MKKTFYSIRQFISAFTILAGLLTYAQDDDFDAIIQEDDTKTATGGFGADLAKNISFVNFNGYITNEFFATQGKNSTFDNHYFNIFISSQLTDKIFIEGQLEYEHGGEKVELGMLMQIIKSLMLSLLGLVNF